MAIHDDFNFTSRSDGGPQISIGSWSTFMNTYNIGGDEGGSKNTRTYSWQIRFNNYGRQTFDTAVDDSGDFYINGVYQFTMGGFTTQTSRTTPGDFAPGVYTISATSVNSGGGPYGVALDWTGFIGPPAASISSFTASPNPQNSTSGTPQYSTRISWATANATSVRITSSAGETFNGLSGSGFIDITNLSQSVVGSVSPTTRNYTIRATNVAGLFVEQTITVQARNDNTPSNSWTQTFSNLTPNTQYEVSLGVLQGVDMPTSISTSGSGNFVGTSVGGSFNTSALFTNGSNVVLKFTSLPFNTDISGQTGIYGKTNTKTIPVTVGTQSFNVTATTRAPRISEDFNYANKLAEYPFQDIDLIANAPTDYLNSATITVDDVELLSSDNVIEIKSSDGNLQVNINNTGWKNVRQI